MFRLINLVAIALFLIIGIILFKFNLVCEVKIAGETVGYVADKAEFEKKVDNILNKQEESKLFTVIDNMPEYKLKLTDKSEKTNEDIILAKLEDEAVTTYKLYAVTVDGKEKTILASLEEAEKIVDEMTKKYENKIKLDIGIADVITTKKKGVSTVKVATADVNKVIKTAVKKKEKEEAKQREIKSHTVQGVYLKTTPVSGIITSRFGNRESIRTRGHTGIDIAAPAGTPIKATADGKITFSGYSGGYGYVVKISHGNGIQTYYGHCSKLYVSTGEKVKAGDVIAAVGSTGNSTGNHLHFEVRVNGQEVNPQKYLYN